MFDEEDKYGYEVIDFDIAAYMARIKSSDALEKQGILVLPNEDWRQTGTNVFMSETFDFVKWAKQNKAVSHKVTVATAEGTKVADLRSEDYWFPLVYLFSDVSLQIYLNMVANYLYDRIKGALKSDKCTVNLEVFAEDKKKGKTRKFSYHGSYEGLREIIKKIDVNEFMEK